MSQSPTVVVTLWPQAGYVSQVEQIIAREIDEIRQAEGCELYELFIGVDGRVVLLERWSTREAWQAHFDTPAIERLKRDLTPLLSQPAERVEMYAPTP